MNGYEELALILRLGAAFVSGVDETPPPAPPPVVVEAAESHVSAIDEPFEVSILPDETDPDWDCRTMGNRRCGTTGPNGERWWYEYDEEGRTIVDEGPVSVPGPPPVPADLTDDTVTELLPPSIDDLLAADPVRWTCLQTDGFEVDVNDAGMAVGRWDSCWPIDNDGR